MTTTQGGSSLPQTGLRIYALSQLAQLRPDLYWLTGAVLIDAAAAQLDDTRAGHRTAVTILAPLVGGLNAAQFAHLLAGSLPAGEEQLVEVELVGGLVVDLFAPDGEITVTL